MSIPALIAACLLFRSASAQERTGVGSAKEAAATGSVPAETGRVFTSQDVFALQQANEVQISPDGRRIVYVRAAADIMTDSTRRSLWIIDPATGEQRSITADGVHGPRWSPDSQRFAYIANDPVGKPQVFVCQTNGDGGSCITGLPEAPDGLAWSPDGRSFAFTMFVPEELPSFGAPVLHKPEGAHWATPLTITTAFHWSADGAGDLRPGHRHLFVVPTEGGSPRQLTSGPFDDDAPAWTPDGRSLLFSSKRGKNRERDLLDAKIYCLRVADGALTQLTHRQAADREPAVSPDGRLIAYASIDGVQRDYTPTNLYVMDADGSNPRLLSATLDCDVSQPRWTHDGRGVLATYDDHGVSKIARFDLDGHCSAVATDMAGDGVFNVADDGTVAFPLGAADHPPEVALCTGGVTRRLTGLNDDLLRDKTLGAVQPLAVVSSLDKSPVDAWMVLPPGYDPARRYPAILAIHGGPYGDDGPSWDTSFQLDAASGYVVLYANYRGSVSNGFAFANRIDHDFPGPAYDDLLSVVDAAVAQGIADPERLFVTGGSAGGELTAWIVGKTNRFKAAAAVKPIINQLSEALSSDQFVAGSTLLFGATPWEDPGVFWSHSPLSLVGRVKTPTMLLVGAEDRRTPPSEAMQFYNALQLCGVPTALVRVPGASHEGLTARPSQFAAENTVILAWFARYGGQAPPGASEQKP
ncbi:MAG: S9 family peptidase [Rhodospirillales bacterium]|nr:S9 family peptidase [Acetobacter sp.]